MANNNFTQEEAVAFEKILEGFSDSLVLSRHVRKYNTDATEMERSSNTIWRPQPYIATSVEAAPRTDVSTLYQGSTQLSVPATIGFNKSVLWDMTARELNDSLNEGRLGAAAKSRLATDINVAIMDVAAAQGTLFVGRTSSASGFDDVSECETIFNEQGIPNDERYLALSSRDYNGMASNLAGRQTMNEMPTEAYRRAYVGQVASFETYKLDYANRQSAAAGGAGITINTTNAGANYYIPQATTQSVAGVLNVDNRYQTVTVSSTANVAAGDAFTIAGINAVHHITKKDTGQLKTFRVISVDSGTTMTVSPPIVTNQVANASSEQYQNCVATVTSATAAIVFLNTQNGYINPFWHKDALEILPGRYSIPTNSGAGVMRAVTEQGIEFVMLKTFNQNTLVTEFRAAVVFGVVCTQPEMTGLLMFGQT